MYKQLAYLAFAVLLIAPTLTSKSQTAERAWLWVLDDNTGLGVPGASVDVGPGNSCIGTTSKASVNWTAHYVTGPAGRAASQPFFEWFSCRVTLNEKQLEVVSAGPMQARPWPGPKYMALQHASQMFLNVRLTQTTDAETGLPNAQRTTASTQFRSYIEDLDDGQLLSDVTVTALRSGVSTTSDLNGLFTLDIPAPSRETKIAPGPIETLVFSKPGYRRYEYRDLIRQPGTIWLTIFLEKGSGMVIHKNSTAHDSGDMKDTFFELKKEQKEPINKNEGEIISLNIEPAHYEDGWIVCGYDAKTIVKARNLKSVDIFFYSTGTGVGEMPPGKLGPLQKVSASDGVDTWEIDLPSELMVTDFWAQGIDKHGKPAGSIDLGNVGCG